jgi:hypothetical protein
MITKKVIFTFFITIFLFNCMAPKQQTLNKETEPQSRYSRTPQKQVLINSIPAQRPEWTIQEPERTDKFLGFVGISNNSATEKAARQSALCDVIRQFAEYCGVEVNDLHKSITTSYGLSSDIRDETVATKGSTSMSTDALVSRVKAKKWYLENWGLSVDNRILERYIKMYVYATVPKDEYDKVIEWRKNKN